MPYLECPGCRVSLYSAARGPWPVDTCAVCGTSLSGAKKQLPTEVRARASRHESLTMSAAVADRAASAVGRET